MYFTFMNCESFIFMKCFTASHLLLYKVYVKHHCNSMYKNTSCVSVKFVLS